jgi:hypothetical protein
MAAKASTRVDPFKPISQLIDCGNVDTVYRDVYLQRARTLLAGVLPVEEFRRIDLCVQTVRLRPAPGRGRSESTRATHRRKE